MIRNFCLMIAMIFSTLPTTIVHATDSDVLLADMYAHPENYIYYGGASIGLSFLVARNSIDVEKYEPPNYVISFQNIEHYSSTTDFVKSRTSRYSYDLDFRRMYVEICVDDVCHWEYLDPNKIKAGSGFDKMTYRYISAGELAFYLAYNQSFYDEIQSAELKRFVEEGRSRVPLVNLPDGGDSQIGHIYNHRTGEMEWWKWDYAVKKFVRVK